MEEQVLRKVRELRGRLHGLAERSGEERRTKACLMEFLRGCTSLELEDEGAWFCAVHREPGAGETVAFRADMDALPAGEGAAHLCGHDGHSAALAGLGLLLEGRTLGRNVVLIFQHGEENGTGGQVCCAALERHRVNRIYAFHNIPGCEEGTVLLRKGVFACASQGMVLSFEGAPAHAAYPEHGRNPGFAAARLMAALPDLKGPARDGELCMATLVGGQIGEKTFGSAAGRAEVWLTLRAWRDRDLEGLANRIAEEARREARRDGVELDLSFLDIFPATVNDGAALERLRRTAQVAGLDCRELPEPFRWSEDFGYYGTRGGAVMVGIGAGVDWPQLHTRDFVFNDAILPTALTLFTALAEKG